MPVETPDTIISCKYQYTSGRGRTQYGPKHSELHQQQVSKMKPQQDSTLPVYITVNGDGSLPVCLIH